jgi:non-specific serine/threonine protein kinase
MRGLAYGGQRNAALEQYRLCRHVLTTELGIEPEAETVALYERIRGNALPPLSSQVVAGSPAADNLPASLPRLIGRNAECARVQDLLTREEVPLLTLTGAPGVGKTHLALHAAAGLRQVFRDGVFFIDLYRVRGAALLASAICRVLSPGQQEHPEPLHHLLHYLRQRRLLLVLDTFEHMLECAPLVADIAATCPGVTLLATSRTPLHLRNERQFPLAPLPVPSESLTASAREEEHARLAPAEGVQLFVEHACRVVPGFALTPDNASNVAAICRRLDGLPLALELAAAQCKLLPPHALLAQLEQPLGVLRGGARDAPARHQSLRHALDWSYDLLNPQEQALFRQLAAFHGPWSLAEAQALCQAGPPDQMAASTRALINHMHALVDKSLIWHAHNASGEPRFGMFATFRAYALEQLAHSGEHPRHGRVIG